MLEVGRQGDYTTKERMRDEGKTILFRSAFPSVCRHIPPPATLFSPGFCALATFALQARMWYFRNTFEMDFCEYRRQGAEQ